MPPAPLPRYAGERGEFDPASDAPSVIPRERHCGPSRIVNPARPRNLPSGSSWPAGAARQPWPQSTKVDFAIFQRRIHSLREAACECLSRRHVRLATPAGGLPHHPPQSRGFNYPAAAYRPDTRRRTAPPRAGRRPPPRRGRGAPAPAACRSGRSTGPSPRPAPARRRRCRA
jgi:hypothetical protein